MPVQKRPVYRLARPAAPLTQMPFAYGGSTHYLSSFRSAPLRISGVSCKTTFKWLSSRGYRTREGNTFDVSTLHRAGTVERVFSG
jgi:hypothetical protein